MAKDIAEILLENGFGVASFPNIHTKGVERVPSVKELSKLKLDLVITVSGDGTILKLMRLLDSSVPCLCVNVGGRGILAEIKPDQARIAIEKIKRGDFRTEKRLRIRPQLDNKQLPPALNEVYVARHSLSKTPTFSIDLDQGSTFTQRMDGVIVSTPTGSTGHAYSYGSPFISGSLNVFMLTPVAPLKRFPAIVAAASKVRVLANYGLQLVIDGQDVFSLEANKYVSFKRHERDAVFVRFDRAGPYRQLKNLGFD